MGRAGIEPATLGLKVRVDELQRTARDRKTLQIAPTTDATNCSETHLVETSLYAHRTHATLTRLTTADFVVPGTLTAAAGFTSFKKHLAMRAGTNRPPPEEPLTSRDQALRPPAERSDQDETVADLLG
jgi:hypothetical protein